MSLTKSERSWLKDYRKALSASGDVQRLLIFGSKARGDDRQDSDLDVLLIIKDKAAARKRDLRRIGYRLAVLGAAVPSIMVYTEAEWEHLRESGSPFRQAVERDEVRVL